ncbi:MAG: hypothetical protein AB1483_12440 [Candidatus Zixiibacteriota bacterium]
MISTRVLAQNNVNDSAQFLPSLPQNQSPPEAVVDSIDSTSTATVPEPTIVDTVVVIPHLEFSSVSLTDAITALSRAYNLSIYIDSSVTGLINLRLDNVTLNDALQFIIRQYDLAWEKTGEIIKVYKPIPPPPEETPLNIGYENGLLSLNVKGVDLNRFVSDLVDLTGKNIVIEGNTRGFISGKLTDLELEKALRVIFSTNNFVYRVVDDVAYVGQGEGAPHGAAIARNLSVKCQDGLVSLEVANQSLSDVISLLAGECGISIFIQTKLEGDIRASFRDKTIDEALTFLLLNSQYTFKESSGIYFIGARTSEDLYDTKLVKLNHLIAATVESVIPVSFSKQLTIKSVKEHNGLVLTGPRTSIAKLESFISEIDVPMAQVLFEVLVVDYTTTDRAEFRITANNFGGDSGLPGQVYYPEIDVSDIGENLNKGLRSLESHLGVSNLGTLDTDFFIRLRMMQQKGTANVQSHPKIAALNGHPASIKIGTSQYYLLTSETSYPTSQTNPYTQTSQRFEVIEADMSLEVVPFVNGNRELIVEVKPEFNTPAESFDPDIPPTINRRVLNSTVRLKDGETIVLGGLVQNTKSKTIDKFPILGSLPLIGRLFQNRTTTDTKSELMIYITPHIYYGSEGSVNIDSLVPRK